MSSQQFCSVERDGYLMIVTLNRPEVMNALHPPACFELSAVFDAFEADPELWIGILTGAGNRAFCAGNVVPTSGLTPPPSLSAASAFTVAA